MGKGKQEELIDSGVYQSLYKLMRCKKTLRCEKQSGAAEACWAHNPEVDGSKPSSASCFVFFLRELFCIFPEGGAKGARGGAVVRGNEGL